MTLQQAQAHAAKMGLSAWTTLAVAVGHDGGETVEIKRVGFADIDLPIAEGETWGEAFSRAAAIIFAA